MSAVRAGDVKSLAYAIKAFNDDHQHWAAFMRAVAKAPCPSDELRKRFLNLWVSNSDSIRNEIGNDLDIYDGLRSLLPRYAGPALRLYRGDSALNRRRRTYGLSWSADRAKAREFAEDRRRFWRTFKGGSVLLETIAPPEAIICAPALLGDHYGEEEYIIDRRRLSAVKVLEHFSQVPL